MSSRSHQFERIAGITFFALITIGCVVVLLPFVTAILWAAILCFASWPLYERAERLLRGRKSVAAALMTVLTVVVFVLPFAVAGFTFAEDVGRVAKLVHDYSRQGVPPVPVWMERIPYLGNYWQALYENTELATQTLKKGVEQLTPHLLDWSLSLGRGILQLALSVLIAFFLYRDGVVVVDRLKEGLRRIGGEEARRVLGVVGTTVKTVVYGLLGTAMAQGIAAGIGFLIAGVPAPFLWALLTFFLSLVPVGPPIVWVPATIWLFARGEIGWGIFMAIWGLVCISGIDNLVRPILISRGVVLPFILTFLGVIGGLLAFGFIGIFIGPTLLAAGFSLLQEYLRRKQA